LGVYRYLLVVPWWRLELSWWRLRCHACRGGRASVIGQECAVRMVFLAKASTVGGNGGGAFGHRFSLMRAPLRVILSMQHRDLRVKI
jgi:hypothetical protein